MNVWLNADHMVWMTISWLFAAGLLITLVWSVVLTVTLRMQRKAEEDALAAKKPREPAANERQAA